MDDSPELYFQQIPEPPDDYAPGNVLARLIDGVGFRYYWATEGLTEEDLAFSPAEDSRSIQETLIHIYGLSETIVNASLGRPNVRPNDWSSLSFDTLRFRTLNNLKRASELCRGKTADEVAELSIIFQNGNQSSQFPYWNMINGPITDAIYHTGQVVMLRRVNGNPINPNVNVFLGRTSS